MTNKLDPKSLPCVFLGYNEKFKGYHCYYPPIRKVFISRHVLFDEHDFPFANLYSKYNRDTTSPLLDAWRSAYIIKNVVPTSEATTEEALPSRKSSTVPTQATAQLQQQ